MAADLTSETVRVRMQFNGIFQVLKNLLTYYSYPIKISLEKKEEKDKGKIWPFFLTETETTHDQHTYVTRNIKGNPSGKRKMIPHGNLDYTKE